MSTTMSSQHIFFDSNKASSHRVDVRNSRLDRVTHNLPSCLEWKWPGTHFVLGLDVTYRIPCTKTCLGQKYYIEVRSVKVYIEEVTHASNDDLKNSLECKICLREFTGETPDLTPRILTNCGHTVCESCAKNLLNETEIVCPFDRTVTNVPRAGGVAQLKKNFTLLEVIQEQINSSATGKCNAVPMGRVQCAENVNHEAIFYCMQCDVDLCERCFTETHKPRFMANHQKISILQKPIKLPNCTQHPYNTAEFLCNDSKCASTVKMMCHTCILTGEHKQHKYELLMDQLLKNEKALSSFLEDIKDRVEREKLTNDIFKYSAESFEPVKGSYLNNIKRIESYFESEKMKALEQFRAFASDSKNKNEAAKQRTESNLKVLESLRSETEQLLKKKNNLFSVNDFLERGKECLLIDLKYTPLDGMNEYSYTLPAIGALEIKKKD